MKSKNIYSNVAQKAPTNRSKARQSQRSTAKDDRRSAHGDLHVVISSETLPNSCRGPTCPNWQVAPNAHFFAEHELPAAHDLHSKGSEKASPRGRIFQKRSRRKATGEAPKMRRIVLFRAILLLALVTARSVAAGPQKQGTATP